MLPSAAGDLDRLRALLAALRLCCRIFYSLNAPGLTPVSVVSLEQLLGIGWIECPCLCRAVSVGVALTHTACSS